MEIINTILRTTVAFFLVLLVTRLIGRKSISQMTFFDFVVSITLGSVTANIGLGSNSNFLTGIIVLLTLCGLAIMMGFIYINSFKLRKLINSEPVIIISNGELIKKNLKKVRMTLNQINTLLREKNIFNISDVNFAILENDGKLSVLPKSSKRALTPIDMNLYPPETGLTKDIIIDGVVLHENLTADYNYAWLLKTLNQADIKNVKEVFFAALDTSGNLYISKGNKKEEKQGEHGIE